MFVAGIDGGGTHTRLELRDGENNLLARHNFGPFNLNSIGREAFLSLLKEVFAACGHMTDCTSLCVGAAGVSNPEVGLLLSQSLTESGFSGRWKLCGDQEIALRGAMDTPGLAVIAGTGSICFGRNGAGETARSGGFGHLIDDGGSGYALGRDALMETVRSLDGRGGSERIRDGVYANLGISTREELIRFVYRPGRDKSAIARLSRVVTGAAEEGDSRAVAILHREAEELAELVRAGQGKLDLPGCPIALLGGLLESDNPYRRTVAEILTPLGQPQRPNHDALWGAAQMAWEQISVDKTGF